MPSRRRRAPRGLPVALALLPALALAARDRSVVPELFGVHALPALENEAPEPVTGARLSLGLSAATRQELALGALLALRLGLRDLAELWMEFMPYERWSEGDRRGAGLGDLWVGFKINGLREGSWWPSVGTRTVVKTATGPDNDRRFTDAADVLTDVLLAKRFDLGAWRLGLWGKAGFFFWQQGGGSQDDAVDYGLTAHFSRAGAALGVEWRGYRGWQTGDKPQQISLFGTAPLGPVELDLSVARGLNDDAPRWLVRVLVAVPIRELKL